jgi:hypothetical protein
MPKLTVALAAVACLTGAASAQQTLITFTYSDLSASFNNATRQFNANAVGGPTGLQTGGDVSRVDVSPTQSANFASGFRGFNPADAGIEMTVSSTVVLDSLGRPTRAAQGAFVLLDPDGDRISGVLTGIWTDLGSGFDSFQGLIGSASISILAGGDNARFNGLGVSGFNYAGLPLTGLSGSLVELQLTPGSFFDTNFANVSTQSSGVLVPGPGSLALIGLGALATARRRR